MTNVVVLQGRVSRPVSERVLPSGDRLAMLDLTVPGPTGEASTKSESVPLAWFGAPTWVLDLEPGADLVVVGRVRRRFFRAGQQLQSRTGAAPSTTTSVRRAARVGELLARAGAALAGLTTASEARPAGRRRAPATFP